MSGKGDTPRPLSVPRKVFEENFERIFKKTDQSQSKEVVSDGHNKENQS